jgi:hypothetical protein
MMVSPSNYPLDGGFIEPLPGRLRDQLRLFGLDDDQVLCFGIPFCAISAVGAGIIRDYSRRCYYKFFSATHGIVEGLPDDQLKFIVDHERHEIRDAALQASEVHRGSAFTTLAAEVQRHVPELENLAGKFGRKTVEDAIEGAAQIASAYPMIPRYVLLFWLTDHVVNRYECYAGSSIPMPEAMLAVEQRKRQMELLDKVSKEYGSRLPVTVYVRLFAEAAKS